MATTADAMEGGFGALEAFWRRLKAFSDQRGLRTFAAMCAAAVLLAALIAALVSNTILDPNVTIVGGALSPDGKWVALTEQIEPGPMMGDIDTAIELRRHDGLLMGPTLNRVFLIMFHSDKVELQRVRWYTDTLLEIRYRASDDDIPKTRTQYKEILIDYLRDKRR